MPFLSIQPFWWFFKPKETAIFVVKQGLCPQKK